MKRLGFLALAIALTTFFAASANATITVRVTDYNAAGTLLGSNTLTGVDPAQTNLTLLPDFSILTATGSQTNNPTAAGLSLTINYTGPVGAATSDTLVVEVLSTPTSPITGTPVFISSNASPSTSGLAANIVQMISGVSAATTIAGFAQPATLAIGAAPAAAPAGLLGTTTGTGTMGTVSSSVLLPNPSVDGVFNIPGSPYGFYQRYTFTQFTVAGLGTMSANSTISAVPEPISLGAWGCFSLIGLGFAGYRRKNKS